MKPDFPHVIDSSMLQDFRGCPQRMMRKYLEHWKPKGESVHLVAGKAFAAGLEAARVGYYAADMTPADSLGQGVTALMREYGTFEPPEGSAKTLDRMLGALEFYFSQYPFESDPARPHPMPSGRPAIEFSFAEPLPIMHPTTGDPLIYSGRSDMIVDFADGIYVEDDKTTTSLGASWSRNWELRSQFTGYCWAAARAGFPVNGVIVRGVSILKTKYDTQQAITYRTDWEIDRWLHQVERDLARMIDCWRSDEWDFALDHACTEYGGCEFQRICKSQDPSSWLPMYFDQRVWDPLARTETPLQEAESWTS